MAVTGAGLFGFVIMHMLGNLQIFLGPGQINAYGHFLQSSPEIIWPARIGLLVMVGLHIWSAVTLSMQNRAARPVDYGEGLPPVAASYASRTMAMSGLIVLCFIIYHLLHFTVQVPQMNLLVPGRGAPAVNFTELMDEHGHHDVYRMMVLGFSSLPVSAFYIIGMALLCMHLSHGVSAMFQSLGLKNRAWGRAIDRFAIGAAALIFIGNCAIPIAVLARLVK